MWNEGEGGMGRKINPLNQVGQSGARAGGIISSAEFSGRVARGGADSDILMKPNSECSEKPVLPGFSEENQA